MKIPKEFLDALPKTGWTIESKISKGGPNPNRICRKDNLNVCPYLWDGITREVLDLLKGIDHKIWAAADKKSGYDPEIRAELLKACGLPPEA